MKPTIPPTSGNTKKDQPIIIARELECWLNGTEDIAAGDWNGESVSNILDIL
ncbi:MAG: hypothetical protein U0930_15580 [Pirellulales bacterium]